MAREISHEVPKPAVRKLVTDVVEQDISVEVPTVQQEVNSVIDVGRQARNFTTNASQILHLKSSSEQIFSRKLPLGAPDKLRFLLCRSVHSSTSTKLCHR